MMNKTERIKMVKAMEYIARQINDEEVFEAWLMCGVGDGDIPYGNLTVETDDFESLDFYLSDKEFADLMDEFLRVMRYAGKKGGGGLYCDNVVSAVGNKHEKRDDEGSENNESPEI